MGALVYLTLLGTTLLKTFEVQTEYLDYFTRNIKSFGSSLICVVSDIEKIEESFEAIQSVKYYLPLGC